MATTAIGADGDRSILAALWDTTRMRLLVALDSERSVSAAARAIGITQSTASEHVRLLELATRQPLVERHGSGSRLTDAGRALSRRAAAALAELAAGEEEIADLAGLQRGRVALAASWSPGVYVLPYTLGCFRRHVPSAVPGIVFLSGGQSDEQATARLNEMNKMAPHPWELSFSYGRALQAPTLKAWKGEASNVAAAQAAFAHRAKCNSAARSGSYTPEMENAA